MPNLKTVANVSKNVLPANKVSYPKRE